jgi:hypothetical protein
MPKVIGPGVFGEDEGFEMELTDALLLLVTQYASHGRDCLDYVDGIARTTLDKEINDHKGRAFFFCARRLAKVLKQLPEVKAKLKAGTLAGTLWEDKP